VLAGCLFDLLARPPNPSAARGVVRGSGGAGGSGSRAGSRGGARLGGKGTRPVRAHRVIRTPGRTGGPAGSRETAGRPSWCWIGGDLFRCFHVAFPTWDRPRRLRVVVFFLSMFEDAPFFAFARRRRSVFFLVSYGFLWGGRGSGSSLGRDSPAPPPVPRVGSGRVVAAIAPEGAGPLVESAQTL